jgi:hypothetical protein
LQALGADRARIDAVLAHPVPAIPSRGAAARAR